MAAAAHLHHRYHALELAFKFDVTLHDDGVGQEGVAVGTEAQHGVLVFQLGRHQHRHAHIRQGRHQAVQRFAEILAEHGGQRHFKAGQRIDDHALGLHARDHAQQVVQDFIQRQVERAGIDHADLAGIDEGTQLMAEQLVRAFLEGGDHAGLAATHAFREKLRGQHGLAGTGWPHQQQ